MFSCSLVLLIQHIITLCSAYTIEYANQHPPKTVNQKMGIMLERDAYIFIEERGQTKITISKMTYETVQRMRQQYVSILNKNYC